MVWLLYMGLPETELGPQQKHIIELARALERTPDAVSLKARNIAATDERRLVNGYHAMSNVGRYDREVWEDFYREGDALILRAYDLLSVTLGSSAEFDSSAEIQIETLSEILDYPEGKTREALVAARVNQSYFRNRLFENYNGRCCVTGLSIKKLLVATHIKSLSVSNSATERLALDNGLLLNALHGRAFDQGLITLDKNLRVVVSSSVPKDDDAANRFIWEYEGFPIEEPKAFKPRPEFIEYHNDVIFQHEASNR